MGLRQWVTAVFMALSAFAACPAAHGDESTGSRVIQSVAVDGAIVEVLPNDNPGLTVVAFLGAECPLARLYGPRLSRLSEAFGDRGVRVIGINSNRQDSAAEIREYVEQFGIVFPLIRDEGNRIADAYGAVRTPEVFLLDEKLDVVYRGRIDDQYEPGVNRAAATREDLRIAIEEHLSGKPIAVAETEPVGCYIGKIRGGTPGPDAADSDITFAKQVSRILQRNCVECHRSGDIGPFALEDYDEVVGWADTILEVIDNGRMPPWHADPNHGDFQNARHMSDSDKATLAEWVAAGMPQGDESEMPAPMDYLVGWQLEKEPDLILPMSHRPFVVPPDGVVEYQYFVVDPGFEEDTWIRASQVLPGNRAVVHHGIVFVRPPDGARFRGVGWLTAYVPGQRLFPLPPGRARKVPAGSKFVFQMHYTPNGSQQQDLSRVGIVFADERDVTHEVFTLVAIDQSFEIPPGAAEFQVKASVQQLPEQAELLAAMPHMHYRGRSFQLFGDSNGRQETLLSIPHYDFNWQHVYFLAEPIPLRNLDKLHFIATFDNSADNPFNPDPHEWVTWGDQTWQEMAVSFFEVSEPRQTETASREKRTTYKPDAARVQAFVDDFFARLDANNDGFVVRSEAPRSLRTGTFERFDPDGDGRATREEVQRLAESKFQVPGNEK